MLTRILIPKLVQYQIRLVLNPLLLNGFNDYWLYEVKRRGRALSPGVLVQAAVCWFQLSGKVLSVSSSEQVLAAESMLRSRGTVDLLRHWLLPQEFWDEEGLADSQELTLYQEWPVSNFPCHQRRILELGRTSIQETTGLKNSTRTNLIGPPDKPRRRMKYLNTLRMMVWLQFLQIS